MSGQVQRRNAQMVELARSEFPRSPWGCAFLAYNSVNDTPSTGAGAVYIIEFDTEVFDLGDDFAWAAGPARWQFTAPATGTYLLASNVLVDDITAAMTQGEIHLVTSNRTYYGSYSNWGAIRTPADLVSGMVVAVADMDAGDTAHVVCILTNGAGNTATIRGHATTLFTFFSGHRIS